MSKPKFQADTLRGARRGIAWLVFTFCVLQLTGGILIDWCPLEVRFPQAATVVRKFKALGRPAEFVFLGSSRSGHCIDDRRVTAHLRDLTGDASVQAFNAGVAGGDLITSPFMLSHLVSAGPPRVAVVEISPEYVCRRSGWLRIHLTRQLRWRDIPPFVPNVISSRALSRLLSSRLIPWFCHRTHFRQWLFGFRGGPMAASRDAILPWMHSDWIAPSKPPDMTTEEESRQRLAGYKNWLDDYEIGGGPTRSLNHLLRLCRDRNIGVLLIATPVMSTHRSLYTAEVEQSFRSYMSRLNREYGCVFVDLRSSVPDSEFSDSHHTSEPGRVRSSEILAREVLAPEWRRQMAGK